LEDNVSPLTIDGFTVRQQCHTGFDRLNRLFGFGIGESKTIPANRSCHCVPKLGDVLVREVERISLLCKAQNS
jgi:hypothetical protein